MTVTTIALPVPFAVRAVNCYLLEGDPLTLDRPRGGLAGDARRARGVARRARAPGRGRRAGRPHPPALRPRRARPHGARAERRDGRRPRAPARVPRRPPGPDGAGGHLPGRRDAPARRPGGRRSRSSTPSPRSTASTAARSRSTARSATATSSRRAAAASSSASGPGTARRDTIFVVEDERLAIVGDHLIGHISSNPVVHRPLDRPASVRDRMPSLPLYLDSLRRTAALDVDVLLPGHGNPVEGHRALVDERLDFHERRKERIFGGLAGRPADGQRARARPLGEPSPSGSRSSRSPRRSGTSTCWRPRGASSSSRATTGCCATRRQRTWRVRRRLVARARSASPSAPSARTCPARDDRDLGPHRHPLVEDLLELGREPGRRRRRRRPRPARR